LDVASGERLTRTFAVDLITEPSRRLGSVLLIPLWNPLSIPFGIPTAGSVVGKSASRSIVGAKVIGVYYFLLLSSEAILLLSMIIRLYDTAESSRMAGIPQRCMKGETKAMVSSWTSFDGRRICVGACERACLVLAVDLSGRR
jgi:hypothetical protein